MKIENLRCRGNQQGWGHCLFKCEYFGCEN